MAHDVFLSYSSKDKAIADTIVVAMESNQIRCWYAPRDIKPSEDWGKAITKAIEECKVFLIIFSGNSNQSQRVLDEVNLAISQQAVILPFRIENLEPEGAMKLHLSSRHWLDAYEPSWQAHIKKLIKDISANLDAPIDEVDIMLPERISKKIKQQQKNLTRILTGIAIGAILIIAGWFGWSAITENSNLGDVEIDPVKVNDAAFTTNLCDSDTYGCVKIEPGNTIKIGLSAPLTGDSANYGIDAKQSGQLAIANTTDLYGFGFELIAKDDGGSSELGAAVAEEFVADPTIVGVAGHLFSGSSTAAIPSYEEAGIPVISPLATKSDLIENNSKVYNQINFSDKVEGFAASEYIYQSLGFRKIAILHYDSPVGNEIAEYVDVGFKALGGEVVAFGKITSNETENQSLIESVAVGEPELLYYCGYSKDGAVVVNLMKSNELEDVLLFGCGGLYNEEFLDQASENVEDAYLTTYRIPKESETKFKFDTDYLNIYGISPGVLSPFSWNCYDSTMALISKVKEVSILGKDGALYIPRGALVDAVRRLENYVGISGTYTCNQMGDCNTEGPQIVRIMDGQFVQVDSEK